MTDKSELLDQLRIDRDESFVAEPKPRGRASRWLLTLASIMVLAVIAVALGWKLSGPPAAPVKVAETRPPPQAQSGPASDGAVLQASGYVVARMQATVSAKITGKLVKLFIEEGEHVEANALVALLDDTNTQAALEQARAGVLQAQANLAQARIAAADIAPLYASDRDQAAAGLISAQALQSSKSDYDARQAAVPVAEGALAIARGSLAVAQRAEEDTVVRAPFAGVITAKAAQPGEIVSPVSAGGGFTRTGIGTLVDMESLEVEVDVNENYIDRVRRDQPATLRLDAYPDWSIPAYVVAIIPAADRSKGTVKVRVGIKSKDPRILPEMGVRVSFLNPPSAQE